MCGDNPGYNLPPMRQYSLKDVKALSVNVAEGKVNAAADKKKAKLEKKALAEEQLRVELELLRSGPVGGMEDAEKRVHTQLPRECWVVVVDFLVGYHMQADLRRWDPERAAYSSDRPNPINISIVPELRQIANLRLVCHDFYDAVKTMKPLEILCDRMCISLPSEMLNKSILAHWERLLSLNASKLTLPPLKAMSKCLKLPVSLSKAELIQQCRDHFDGTMSTVSQSIPPAVMWRLKQEKRSVGYEYYITGSWEDLGIYSILPTLKLVCSRKNCPMMPEGDQHFFANLRNILIDEFGVYSIQDLEVQETALKTKLFNEKKKVKANKKKKSKARSVTLIPFSSLLFSSLLFSSLLFSSLCFSLLLFASLITSYSLFSYHLFSIPYALLF